MIDASRKAKDVFKNKRVKCMRVAQGKVYAGCSDSSIQELMITNNRHQEMKAPSKSWMQNKPISSISMYKEWLYGASLVVEGSKTKVKQGYAEMFFMLTIQFMVAETSNAGLEAKQRASNINSAGKRSKHSCNGSC